MDSSTVEDRDSSTVELRDAESSYEPATKRTKPHVHHKGEISGQLHVAMWIIL